MCKPLSCDATTFHSHSTSKLADDVTQSPLVPILSSMVVQVPLTSHSDDIIPTTIAKANTRLPINVAQNDLLPSSTLTPVNMTKVPTISLTTTPAFPLATLHTIYAPSASDTNHVVPSSSTSATLSISSSPIMYI